MSAHILVVDPEAQIRELLKSFFEKNGYTAQTVATPEEALNILSIGPIDLVVTEIALADKDGVVLLADIKREFPKVPVIMLTGIGFVEDLIQECSEKGADGYLSKILPLDELLIAVQRALKTQPARA